MNRIGYVPTLCAALLLGAVLPAACGAQIMEGGIALDRLQLLGTPGTGARPFALGGAYTAVSDDAFGLLYNPAGLAQLRRREFAFGIHHLRDEIGLTTDAAASSQSSTYTSFGHIAAAYPVPTYRGSLVIGFGVFRVGNSDLEYTRISRVNDIEFQAENILLQSGTIFRYILGFGVEISPTISLGANFSVWDQSLDFTEQVDQESILSSDWAVFKDNAALDMDGVSFDLGALVHVVEEVRCGVMVSSPVWISYDGTGIRRFDGRTSGEEWTTDDIDEYVEDEYTLPLSVRAGIAVELAEMLLLSADFSWADYTQTEYQDLRIRNDEDPGREILESTWTIGLGAEFTLPDIPVSLRGGYAYRPLASTVLDEVSYVRDEGETVSLITVWDYSDVTTERRWFTFGAGGVIDRVFAIDAAVTLGRYERETTEVSETRDFTEFIVSGTYRF